MSGKSTSMYARSLSANRASSCSSSRKRSEAGSVMPGRTDKRPVAQSSPKQRDVARHLGPRADQAHVAAETFAQLRQLVELGAAQHSARTA